MFENNTGHDWRTPRRWVVSMGLSPHVFCPETIPKQQVGGQLVGMKETEYWMVVENLIGGVPPHVCGSKKFQKLH